MQSAPEPLAIRALPFTRPGCHNVRFELHRSSRFDFQIIEDGERRGLFWSGPSPEQALTGNHRPLTLAEAWQRVTEKRFQGYSASEFEELSLDRS